MYIIITSIIGQQLIIHNVLLTTQHQVEHLCLPQVFFLLHLFSQENGSDSKQINKLIS